MRIVRWIDRHRLQIEGVLLLTLLSVWAYTDAVLPALARREAALAREERQREANERLEHRLRLLEERCEALRAAEPRTVETVLREEFGWGRPGEVVIDLGER